MSDQIWRVGNPLVVDIVAPIDKIDPSAPALATGGTLNVKVFEKNSRQRVTIDVAPAAVLVYLNDTSDYSASDRIALELADGTIEQLDITSIDQATNEITLTSGPSDTVKAGTQAYVALLASSGVAGAEYGTAALDSEDWGYIAEIPWPPTSGYEWTRGLTLLVLATLDVAGSGAHWERIWPITITDQYDRA
jgi:hypothetical protein